MPSSDIIEEIKLLIRSRYGLIAVESQAAESLLKYLAEDMMIPYFSWKASQGLQREGYEKSVYGTEDAGLALEHIRAADMEAIYHFKGLDLNELSERLIEAGQKLCRSRGAIIISGSKIDLPEELRHHCAIVVPPPPAKNDYHDLLMNIYRDLSREMPLSVAINKDDMQRLLGNLKGLSLLEAEKILTKAMVEDGTLDAKDIQAVVDAKRKVVEREGLLEYFPLEQNTAEIAGLENLKGWLSKRQNIILKPEAAEQFGLEFPKGILLLGVPGAGKSLCAKAVAMQWGLPLLKMDPSGLYNKYIGESEKNFKRAMQAAEHLAPVILWLDEIEKAFAAGGSEDGGVSQRVLGTFLSWMQERKGDIFVVATSNDVSKLPPELLRKGRFDEIFFVDLPSMEDRAKIFAIHLRKRKRNPQEFDLEQLAAASQEFSGAEIEQVIVAALYSAFSEGREITTAMLIEECRQTTPLAVTRVEDIRHLRSWCQNRAVSAK